MQALQTGVERVANGAPRESVRAWIESQEGSIARGVVEVLSEDGVLLQLTNTIPVSERAEVVVRLSFDPASPTLGLAARVLRFQANGEGSDCEVEWLPGPDHTRVGSLVSAYGAV